MFDLVQTVDQRGPLGGVLKAQRAHLLQVPATSGADAPGSAPAMAQQELFLPMPGAATVTTIVCTRTCAPASRTFPIIGSRSCAALYRGSFSIHSVVCALRIGSL